MPEDRVGSGELFSLTGRIAVVTGGGQGLGKTIAEGLAAFGASLVIADIQKEPAHQTAAELAVQGHHSFAVECDVADEAQVEQMIQKTLKEFGRIDVLVNNAGISRRHPVEAFPLDEWKHVLDVNLVGVFLCARSAGQAMARQHKGSIINVASIAGFTGRATRNTAYLAAKAGVVNLTRALAVHWASAGVRVNAVAPAEMDSPMLAALKSEPEALAERVARIPMGRIGQPYELIGPVVFLASDASSFVTGHTLPVDGGALAY
jgi:NAD(P)-dependent dehydrogenase (short-subunit alcohol dehydrogenase family)